jgi:hypothetical protein
MSKVNRVSADDLSTVVGHSIERALEVRKAAGIELNQAEMEQVSGGGLIYVNGGIINGLLDVYRFNFAKNLSLNLNLNQLKLR